MFAVLSQCAIASPLLRERVCTHFETDSVYSPAPCGRGLGGRVRARQRASESVMGLTAIWTVTAPNISTAERQESCAPAGAGPRPLAPAHKGRGNGPSRPEGVGP
jgi:hypothetical protein